jgi:Arc/MetJ-type ribon-helix-helix transcriptional regulator
MATMNISLPDEMKAFIEAQMAAEGFASAVAVHTLGVVNSE